MKRPYFYTAIILCALLSACGGVDVKESLGLNRTAPDEFRVYSRPPLSVPPEFNLTPPGSGGETASGLPADAQAKSKVLGTAHTPAAVSTGPLPSSADAQFLSNVGATRADPQVRSKIDAEKDSSVTVKEDGYLFGGKSGSDPVVDATKESARVKKDKDQNKPVTGEGTPVVVPKGKGILGDIF